MQIDAADRNVYPTNAAIYPAMRAEFGAVA
jgi:hypothetical protein